MLQGTRRSPGSLSVLGENRDGIYLIKKKILETSRVLQIDRFPCNMNDKLSGTVFTHANECEHHWGRLSEHISLWLHPCKDVCIQHIWGVVHHLHFEQVLYYGPCCSLFGLYLNNSDLRTGLKGYFPGPGEMIQWLKHLPHKNTGVWISGIYANKYCLVLVTSL